MCLLDRFLLSENKKHHRSYTNAPGGEVCQETKAFWDGSVFVHRSLEEHLREKRLSQEFPHLGPELEHVLLQLDLAQKNEKNLQSEVAHLEGR